MELSYLWWARWSHWLWGKWPMSTVNTMPSILAEWQPVLNETIRHCVVHDQKILARIVQLCSRLICYSAFPGAPFCVVGRSLGKWQRLSALNPWGCTLVAGVFSACLSVHASAPM